MGKRTLAIVGCYVMVAITAYAITVQAGPEYPKGVIDVLAAPKGSVVHIDGNKASAGENTVAVGTHTVTVSKKGFTAVTKQEVVKENDTVKVGFTLQSNAKETANWYHDHEDDAKLAEGISSELNDYNAQQTTGNNPIFQVLPVTLSNGHGGQILISSGVPANNSGQPAVHIVAQSVNDRHTALRWIVTRGYNVSDFDIVFENEVSVLRPADVQ